jgi:hypothetical protein
VAVTVTVVLEVTIGALSSPAVEIEPAVVVQLTAVLKFPVPVTVAAHWLVWPEETVDGEQLTLTPVIVPVLPPPPPPPPQAASSDRLPSTSKNPSLRTLLSPSANFAGFDAWRN